MIYMKLNIRKCLGTKVKEEEKNTFVRKRGFVNKAVCCVWMFDGRGFM